MQYVDNHPDGSVLGIRETTPEKGNKNAKRVGMRYLGKNKKVSGALGQAGDAAHVPPRNHTAIISGCHGTYECPLVHGPFRHFGLEFFHSPGLDENYYVQKQMGVFALKHFIQYFAEVKAGETVAMRIRLLGRTEKRFHFMNFMINETTGKLAAILEVLGTHADLKLRKAVAMPQDITQKFDAQVVTDQQRDWEAPLSGAIEL